MFEELGQKDFMTGLLLWVVIEAISFGLLPALGAIQPGDRMRLWLSISVPLGLGGAFLLGMSSRFVAITSERSSSDTKSLNTILGQSMGWLAMIGILFPFFTATGEFFAKSFRW
jgi:asparagine N-glycosylation enzyme membrane subunit Stt3